jgi:hypothetical protein
VRCLVNIMRDSDPYLAVRTRASRRVAAGARLGITRSRRFLRHGDSWSQVEIRWGKGLVVTTEGSRGVGVE